VEPGQGALVAEVAASSAAGKAGLKPGDVVTRVGDRPVNSAQDFLNAEGRAPIGEQVTIEYLRNEKKRTLSLQINELRELTGGSLDSRLEGALFTEAPASGNSTGALLAELERRSRLAYEGLRPGDIITGINGETINGLDDLEEVMANTRGRLILQLRRGGEAYIARID
jgi:S1-C subfamily serine protease